MVKALLRNLILKPIETKTASGLDLPKEYNNKRNIAEIVNIGAESKLNNLLKPGDHVVFIRPAVIAEIEGMFIVNEEAVLAKNE